MLAGNQAQTADNVKLYTKELSYWRGQSLVYVPLLADVRTIYRLYKDADTSAWLVWAEDVSVAPGPLADTTEGRVYYTGSGSPKKTNYAMSTASEPYPTSYYNMGVPAPVTSPTVVCTAAPEAPDLALDIQSQVRVNDSGSITGSVHISGEVASSGDSYSYSVAGSAHTLNISDSVGLVEDGAISQTPTPAYTVALTSTSQTASTDLVTTITADVETRAYVYTYLNTFGTIVEESAPSPPSALIDVPYGQLVTVSAFATPPSAGYNITGIRVYRTVTGQSVDSYQFVTEFAVGTSSYEDGLVTAQLGEELSTTGWLPPPEDLAGLVALSNGSLAGFVGNTVYFSEPYFAHAWPLDYAISLPFNIVGLGVFGSSLVACTERFPYIITGVAPGAMTSEQLPLNEPCVARSSIASDVAGVIYASPNGLVSIGIGQASVVTGRLYRRDEWQAINPEYLRGAIYDNKYFGIYGAPYQSRKAIVISRDDIPALSPLEMEATCAFVDNRTAQLFVVNTDDNKIYQVDADTSAPYTFTWRSKRFVFPQAISFSAAKMDANYAAIAEGAAYQAEIEAIELQNASLFLGSLSDALNDTELNVYAVNGSAMLEVPLVSAERMAQINIYGDGTLQCTLDMTALDPIRVPAFRAREYEVEIIGNIPIRELTLATTVQELAYGDT